MLALDGGAVDERAVRGMAGALVHRGPDSEGLFADGPVALAARRLAIIDLARGDQPMRNEDGSVTVVQNGELYEHRSLQAELERRGHRFASHCDTEVLPHLYEERGAEFAVGLRGMFAIALWDARERRLLLARDPFGIKPLYYRVAGGVLSFASKPIENVATAQESPGAGTLLNPRYASSASRSISPANPGWRTSALSSEANDSTPPATR